jgi:heptosyltransferase-3
MTRALVARLDSLGDVLLAGPAVAAVAAGSSHVTLLVSPEGEAAARLLPGVDDLIVWACPWTGYQPPGYDPESVDGLVRRLRDGRYDVALVLTSYHQSPLPLALLLRQARVERIVASSHDYPGSLLDVRHPPGGPHEVQRNLSLAAAAGFAIPDDGSAGLAVRRPLPELPAAVERLRGNGYVVVHPAASVPARSISPDRAAAIATALAAAGHDVVVTGRRSEECGPLPSGPSSAEGGRVVDLLGRTTLPALASVLAGARCLVSGNTGPAHLAAAVGTPVVSLFAPVVPADAWRPWGVPTVVLGDQLAACAGTRARTCPVPGHPCVDGVSTAEVVDAVGRLARSEVAA